MNTRQIDLTSQDFKRDPFATFARLREIGPILKTRVPLLGECWITTTYEAADKVLRDKDQFCTDAINAGLRSRTAMLGPLQWVMPKAVKAMMSNMLTMDEPDHRRLRSLVESAFVRQSVDDLRPHIAAIVDDQLDWLEQSTDRHGNVSFQQDFARTIPLRVICELLGLPEKDHDKFTRWCDFSGAKGAIGTLWAMRGLGKLQRYLRKQFEACRQTPRPGMMSALVQVEHDGDRLSEEELLASVMILLLAGHETTTHLITIGLLALEQHPDSKDELMADWSKAEAAVDEMLRFNSTIQMTKPRYVRQDMEFYGHQIKRGEFFLPMLAAANCDPAEFPEPKQFDIHRDNNHHMAFGRGIHVCLGLNLAKAEAAITFERLLTRFPDLQIAIPHEQLQWTERIGTRSLMELPVKLSILRDATTGQ